MAKIIATLCRRLRLELLTGSDGLKRADLLDLLRDGLQALLPREHVQAIDWPHSVTRDAWKLLGELCR